MGRHKWQHGWVPKKKHVKRKVEKDTKENPSVFEKELTSLMLFVSVGPKYVAEGTLSETAWWHYDK